jgi:hypothetical protein
LNDEWQQRRRILEKQRPTTTTANFYFWNITLPRSGAVTGQRDLITQEEDKQDPPGPKTKWLQACCKKKKFSNHLFYLLEESNRFSAIN